MQEVPHDELLVGGVLSEERWTISRGSVNSHSDYGKRMPLSFNNKIQSKYYQNCSVSVEGASLEWVVMEGD